jgi:DNA-binding SARP family transcriptional activator/Tfp pilus assembly protein PilF
VVCVHGLEFRILGPLEVWRDGAPVPVTADRQRAVLAALLLQANQVVATDRLVALVWGERPPATARNTLQTLVRRLRRLLAPADQPGADQPLLTRPPGYLLRVERDRLDLTRFEDLARRGREALASGRPAAAGQLLGEAINLWRGAPLADVAVEELRRTAGTRLEEWYLQAVEQRLEAELRRGRHAESIGELRRLVAEHPLREQPYGQLMRALHEAGRPAEALDAYRVLREVLVDQLGIEPGPAIQQLHRTILHGGPEPAAVADRVVPRQLPPDVSVFTGRTEELARLDAVLATAREPAAVPVVAVVGTPGVGKTALTVHWAHRVRDRFPDGQLYVDLRGYASAAPLRPIDALASFLRALGLPADAVPVEEQEAAARYRTLLADRRVLVVLDNARGAAQVRPLLPGGPRCLVLVTSRDRLDGLVAHEGARRLTVDALPPAQARTLLTRALGTGTAADPRLVADLARQCGYLPLALRLAAANLAGRPDHLAGYAARLATDDPLAGLAVVGDDDQSAVRTAFGLSYVALPGAAARLFRLLGVVPGADLPVPAAAALAGLPVAAAGQLLDRLAAAHLVYESASGRFSFHDLLRHYAAELAAGGPAAERTEARERLYGWYVATADAAARRLYPERLRLPPPARPAGPAAGDPAGWEGPGQALAWLDAERANLVAAAGRAAADGPRRVAWLLADALRGYLSQRGHAVEWDALSRAALAAAEAEGDLTAQAAAQLSRAELHWRRKQYLQAIDLHHEVVKLSERAGWPAGMAGAHGNLGMIYRDLGQGESAAECHTRALELNRRIGRLAGEANNLANLGAVRTELGQLARAADCFVDALELYRRLGSLSGQASTRCNLGDVYLVRGWLPQAQTELTASLELFEQIGTSVDRAEALRLLAEVHRAAGRTGPARTAVRAAIDHARETGTRTIEARALVTLGSIELAAGRPAQAIASHREALALARATGTPYPQAQAHLGLAAGYRRLGRTGPATAHAGQALTIARGHGYRALEDRAVWLATEPPPTTGDGHPEPVNA